MQELKCTDIIAYGVKNSNNNTVAQSHSKLRYSSKYISPIHTQFTLPTDGFRPTLHSRDISAEGKLLTRFMKIYLRQQIAPAINPSML